MKNKFIIIAAFLMLSSCLALVEKTGRALDGSAFEEKEIALYQVPRPSKKAKLEFGVKVSEVQNKAGVRSIVMSLDNYPFIKLRGTAPDADGTFYLTSLDYLAGNTHGWNEYSLDVLGSGTFKQDADSPSNTLTVAKDMEPIQISSGRIHRFDTRITGDEALTALRNRHDRILALVEWLHTQDTFGTATNALNKETGISEFHELFLPLLFPERTSGDKQPADWKQQGDAFVRAESIRWNTTYTDRMFPEHLRAVRNTGTLYRDWEEALDWIHLEYEWKRIMEKLSAGIVLQKVK